MSINPTTAFPGKIAAASLAYPYGEAQDITLPGDGTGTPFVAQLLNDIFGFQQAMLSDAGIVPTGTPDAVGASQYLDALRTLLIVKKNTRTDALADTNLKVGQTVRTLGYKNVADGGAAEYNVVADLTGTVDDFDYSASVPPGAFQLELVRDPAHVNVRQAGAVNENVTADTVAFQAAVAKVIDFSEFEVPPGKYRLEASIDFKGKLGIAITGVRRASFIMFNHAGTTGFDFENPGPTSQGRAITMKGLSFYSAVVNGPIPDEAVLMQFCPESDISGCTFIECATVNQLRIKESWSSSIHKHCFFSVDEPGLTSTYGSPANNTSTGVGLYIDSNSHAMTVHQNRIRTGYPSMVYAGGDAAEISNNQIEGGKTNGLEISNATAVLEIKGNYFEGAQTWDIVYTAAGTNFSHEIHANYFHSQNGIWIQDGCDTNGLIIHNNNSFSNGTFLKIDANVGFKGIKSVNNTLRDVLLPYDIPSSSMKTLGLTHFDNMLKLDDIFLGTTPKTLGFPETSIIPAKRPWATFAGTGTVAMSSVNHGGYAMYDIVETSAGVAAYTVSIDFEFDESVKGKYISVNMPITATSGNVSVVLDDGVGTKTFTLNSAAIGASAEDNRFYHLMPAGADKIRLRLTVDDTLTVQTLIPSVRMGCHSDVVHSAFTPKLIVTDTAALTDITNAINTAATKTQGFRVYNATTNLYVVAADNTDGGLWLYLGTGSTAHTPV